MSNRFEHPHSILAPTTTLKTNPTFRAKPYTPDNAPGDTCRQSSVGRQPPTLPTAKKSAPADSTAAAPLTDDDAKQTASAESEAEIPPLFEPDPSMLDYQYLSLLRGVSAALCARGRSELQAQQLAMTSQIEGTLGPGTPVLSELGMVAVSEHMKMRAMMALAPSALAAQHAAAQSERELWALGELLCETAAAVSTARPQQ